MVSFISLAPVRIPTSSFKKQLALRIENELRAGTGYPERVF